jgi:hypothetical protein
MLNLSFSTGFGLDPLKSEFKKLNIKKAPNNVRSFCTQGGT